jgi:type IV secretory pathway VirD2 relaxase
VVETNDRTHNYTVVKFYDLADQLVYEERLEGVHLDVSRRKNRRLLNQTLHRVVHATLLGSQLAGKEASPGALIAKKRGDTSSR